MIIGAFLFQNSKIPTASLLFLPAFKKPIIYCSYIMENKMDGVLFYKNKNIIMSHYREQVHLLYGRVGGYIIYLKYKMKLE